MSVFCLIYVELYQSLMDTAERAYLTSTNKSILWKIAEFLCPGDAVQLAKLTLYVRKTMHRFPFSTGNSYAFNTWVQSVRYWSWRQVTLTDLAVFEKEIFKVEKLTLKYCFLAPRLQMDYQEKLQHLDISQCDSVIEFVLKSNLKTLRIISCFELRTVSCERSPGLKLLSIQECPNVNLIVVSDHLTDLSISGCPLLRVAPIPSQLVHVRLYDLPTLVPPKLGTEITTVDLSFTSVKTLQGLQTCIHLTDITVKGCRELEFFSVDGASCWPELTHITCNHSGIRTLQGLDDHPCLKYLVASSCYNLVDVHAISYCRDLRYLDISRCDLLNPFKPAPKVETFILELSGWNKMQDGTVSPKLFSVHEYFATNKTIVHCNFKHANVHYENSLFNTSPVQLPSLLFLDLSYVILSDDILYLPVCPQLAILIVNGLSYLTKVSLASIPKLKSFEVNNSIYSGGEMIYVACGWNL